MQSDWPPSSFLCASHRQSPRAKTVAPPFNGVYSIIDLGPATGVPNNYGGLAIKMTDTNKLLIGGAANTIERRTL